MTPAGLALRPLTEPEVSLCVPLGEAMHAEMRLPGTFRGETFVHNWRFFLQHSTSAILGLWQDEDLVGVIGGLIVPDQYDTRLVANEFFFYISPASRQGTGALRLLRGFEHWAQEHGAEEVRLIHLLTASVRPENPMEHKLAHFYRRLGFQPLEVAWRKVLKGD